MYLNIFFNLKKWVDMRTNEDGANFIDLVLWR